MCGIAGHFRSHGAATPLDLRLIAHRGPDAAGEWLSDDGRIWLGNTRLAILDLSPAGAQPMIDPATGNVLIVNGEIYNHLALRAELSGVEWRGTSDTETLLQAYARWGRDALVRLKGMFAFAIFDQARDELFVARDRLGIKPLYYAVDDGGLRFASEVKVLAGPHPGVTPESVAAYLQWGACPEDRLLFEDIETLPAGHFMTISNSGELEVSRYWPGRKNFVSPNESVPQRVRALLETAVEEHLLSDVPVASFLSGGIDSSIITALAAQKMERKLETFSVGFDVVGFDESNIALAVAQRFGTKHERIRLSEAEVIEAVTEAVGHLDLPSVDAINTYIVARAVAQRGVKVALSGLGGDELFGGYPSFRDVPRLQLLALLPRFLRKAMGGARLADLPNDSGAAGLAQWRRRFFTDEMLRAAGLPNERTPLPMPVELPDDFARISWAELTGYMRRMLLRDSDQMSMAVSLELRVPFLDHELVEYSLGLPAAEKRRYRGVKGLLVEACRDLLPPAVYQRPKAGFALPMQKWMEGPLASFVERGLEETVATGLLPEDFVAQARLDFRSRQLHWTRLWSMVVLGHFVRQNRSHENPALHSFA
ncbi:MAG: asparagine synthase (glutamine-hydrolyzing) [Chthoniobacterales bacterium]|nr:asparagine synthase (glutamine-hydrolyzing) [Chthoniobacterales bacterium]